MAASTMHSLHARVKPVAHQQLVRGHMFCIAPKGMSGQKAKTHCSRAGHVLQGGRISRRCRAGRLSAVVPRAAMKGPLDALADNIPDPVLRAAVKVNSALIIGQPGSALHIGRARQGAAGLGIMCVGGRGGKRETWGGATLSKQAEGGNGVSRAPHSPFACRSQWHSGVGCLPVPCGWM